MKEHLGSTVLFQVHTTGRDQEVLEGKVEALSESGKYARIGGEWFAAEKVNVLEVLTPAKKTKAPAKRK